MELRKQILEHSCNTQVTIECLILNIFIIAFSIETPVSFIKLYRAHLIYVSIDTSTPIRIQHCFLHFSYLVKLYYQQQKSIYDFLT